MVAPPSVSFGSSLRGFISGSFLTSAEPAAVLRRKSTSTSAPKVPALLRLDSPYGGVVRTVVAPTSASLGSAPSRIHLRLVPHLR